MRIIYFEAAEGNGQFVKTHICSNDAIAREVAKDLECRFGGKAFIKYALHNNLHLDFGGSIMTTWTTHDIPLKSGVTFSFWPHQAVAAICKLRRAVAVVRGEGTPYVKLHSAYNCLCMSPEEAQEALVQAEGSEVELEAQAVADIKEFHGRLDDIRTAQENGDPGAMGILLPKEKKFIGEA